jgi:prepilin-type N-terminal cleavage/methylation domain-containing protein
MVSRAGFSLAEVVVAMLLLSIAAVGVAGAGVAAAQMFTRAEKHELAMREAESILDSLLTLRAHSAGTRMVQQTRIIWTAADSSGATSLFVQASGRTIQLTGQR